MELDVPDLYLSIFIFIVSSGSVFLYFKLGSDLVVGAHVLKDFVVSCC